MHFWTYFFRLFLAGPSGSRFQAIDKVSRLEMSDFDRFGADVVASIATSKCTNMPWYQLKCHGKHILCGLLSGLGADKDPYRLTG